jgi:RNA polymerase sigma-70 factor, ECF subfamily
LTIIPLPRPDAHPDGPGDPRELRLPATGSAAGPVVKDPAVPGIAARVASREIGPAADEAELARRLAAGDPAALTAITEWLWEPLAAYAWRIVEDRDVARDIAQEACVRLWDRRGQESPRAVRPYLFRIARNLALDHLKTRRTRRRLLQRHDAVRTRSATPDELLESDRISAGVQHAIQALPDRRREVFVLAYLRGLSYAEVGEVLGISPKTVQNQMTAALAQLRTTLRPLFDERSPVTASAGGGDDER